MHKELWVAPNELWVALNELWLLYNALPGSEAESPACTVGAHQGITVQDYIRSWSLN